MSSDAAPFIAGGRFGVIDGESKDHTVGVRSVNGTAVSVFQHVEVWLLQAGILEASFHLSLGFGIHVHRDVNE